MEIFISIIVLVGIGFTAYRIAKRETIKKKIEMLVFDSRITNIDEISNLVGKPYADVLKILKLLVKHNKASVEISRHNKKDVDRRVFELGNARIDEVRRQFLLPLVTKIDQQEKGVAGAFKRAFNVKGKDDYQVVGYETVTQEVINAYGAQTVVFQAPSQSTPQTKSIHCPSCGANNSGYTGNENICEYCGSHLR